MSKCAPAHYSATRPPPSDVSAEGRARRDELRTIARDIPDPEWFADKLPLDVAQILIGATGSGSACRVHHGRVAELRSLGLVEFGGNFLTAFGMKVRRHLMEPDA